MTAAPTCPGSATVHATFRFGTLVEMVQVDVQNRLKAIEARLPAALRQTGATVGSASPSFLMIVRLMAEDGQHDEVASANCMTRRIVEELERVPGVGHRRHMLAFIVLPWTAMAAYPRLSPWWILIGHAAFGGGIELAQLGMAIGRNGARPDRALDIARRRARSCST